MTVEHVVRVSSSALTSMQVAGGSALPYETGGILLGFRAAEGVVVTRALVVHDARSTGHDYLRDETQARAALATARTITPPVVGYVGEWHTHPAAQPPSRMDIATLVEVASSHADVVVLLVLPFTTGRPRPAHAMLGARAPTRALFRRRRAVALSAQLVLDERSADALENAAETSAVQDQGADEP